MKRLALVVAATFIAACGSLEKKAILINPGDTKDQVITALGTPDDRQLQGLDEAWQYCQTGAGFGYHDYRVVWFYDGRVTGLTSYKSTRPGASCRTDLQPIRWEDAPDASIEIRNR